MSSNEIFNTESADIAMDAALAANAAWDRHRGYQEQLVQIIKLDLEGVIVDSSAQKDIEQRIEQANADFEMLVSMAGLVTSSSDPYDTDKVKELTDRRRFVTRVQSSTGENISAITANNFKAAFLCVNGDQNISTNAASGAFTVLCRQGREVLSEDYFLESNRLIRGQRTYICIRTETTASLIADINEHPEFLGRFGARQLSALKQVLSFYAVESSSLLLQPEVTG